MNEVIQNELKNILIYIIAFESMYTLLKIQTHRVYLFFEKRRET